MTIKGIEPVIVTFNNLSKHELYNKAINWTNSHYENTNKATITTYSDDNISINGSAKEVLFASILGNDMRGDLPYLFSIDFTDGEIRMTFTLDGEKGDITDENGAGINISPSSMFNKNGEVRKMSKDFKAEAEKIMNEIASSLVDYLIK